MGHVQQYKVQERRRGAIRWHDYRIKGMDKRTTKDIAQHLVNRLRDGFGEIFVYRVVKA